MAESNYVCPKCGAEDSGRCVMLPPAGVRPYSERKLRAARDVGCRIAYYTDKELLAEDAGHLKGSFEPRGVLDLAAAFDDPEPASPAPSGEMGRARLTP